MIPGRDDLGISTAALPLLRDLIHERAGLLYTDDRLDLLLDRLVPLVLEAGFNALLDYYYLLKYDPKAEVEWPRLMDALAVPESYFWREIDQLRAVVSSVVPTLLQRFKSQPLRIWSIPCAGGEEPLTVAMLLNEAGWFERAAIEVHGSDASPAAIARARAGVYRDRAFRSLPANLQNRYFQPTADGWRVAPELHARVTSWTVQNLIGLNQLNPLTASPVILCRNVFIYFSPASVRQVVDHFASRMPAPAYLCVGASESLLTLTTRFQLEEIAGAFIYVKPGPDENA